jgi:hypothetical protein
MPKMIFAILLVFVVVGYAISVWLESEGEISGWLIAIGSVAMAGVFSFFYLLF